MNHSLALLSLLTLITLDTRHSAPLHSFSYHGNNCGERGQFWRRYTGRSNRRR